MKLGIILNEFGLTDMHRALVSNLNKMKNVQITAFHNEFAPIPESPMFAIMQQEYLWGYRGPVVAIGFSSARRLLKIPGPIKKYLYLWELDWGNLNLSYDELQNVYQNDNLDLISRNDKDDNIITNCWKKPITTIEDFNYEQLEKIAS